MKNIICLLVCFTFIQVGLAQKGRLKSGDRYYEKVAYALAAERYEKVRETKFESPMMLGRLADCYYQMGNTVKAEEVYALMIDDENANTKDLYQYAQALKENEKYEMSDVWMRKFAAIDHAALIAREFKQNENYLAELSGLESRFSIRNLGINTEFSDFGGYSAPGGLEVFFLSNRTKRGMVKMFGSSNLEPFLDLYYGKISNSLEIINPVVFSQKVNTRLNEGPICYMSDRSRVFFTRNNTDKSEEGTQDEKGIQNLKIYYADVKKDGAWTNIKEFPISNREYSVGHPVVSKDGSTLYFASDMPGGMGGSDLYSVSIVTGLVDLFFGTPVNLGTQINTEGQEMFPWLDTLDNLYFSSDGHQGLGGLDVFIFNGKGNAKELINLGQPINSPKDDFAFIMNRDGLTGYFSSNRKEGKGDDDIYSFVMTKPLEKSLFLKGLVVDKKTSGILPGAKIYLMSEGEPIDSAIAATDGSYRFIVEPEFRYTLKASKGDYFDSTISISTLDLEPEIEVINMDLALRKDPGIGLYVLVTDIKTGEPLDLVTIKVIDLNTGKVVIDTVTNKTGDTFNELADNRTGDCLNYQVIIVKDGYLGKTAIFKKCIETPGIIELHNLLNVSLGKLEVGVNIAAIMTIEPIYFDLDKFNIRPDAEIGLSKIVAIMNENPNLVIELESHTDCIASRAYNESLSEKRAKSSASWVQKRVESNPSRIYGKGYGESKLKNDCACEGSVKSTCSEEEHQLNRRTEFTIIKM